jgi:flavin reductase (DIM6/NTAB) family NADH-FMN oxidoreductase RutF
MIDPDEFRAVMRNLVSGVTVVTTSMDGQRFGMTVTAFSSVSLEPTLIQVSLERDSRTHEAVRRSGTLAISILEASQDDVAHQFAAPGSDAFEGCDIELGEMGLPLIAGAIGQLECRVVEEFQGGDHTIFIGEVLEGRSSAGAPLVHFQGSYRGIADEKGMT